MAVNAENYEHYIRVQRKCAGKPNRSGNSECEIQGTSILQCRIKGVIDVSLIWSQGNKTVETKCNKVPCCSDQIGRRDSEFEFI